jgi:hypothetical protein
VSDLHYGADPEEIGALLGDTGYAVERLSRYDKTEFPPGWHGFAATKGD